MTNKKKTPPRAGGEKPKRANRSLADRLADEKRKVADLEARVAQQKLDKALEEGLVATDDQAEFKLLKSEVAAVRKAEKAVQRALDRNDDYAVENVSLLKDLEEFRDGLCASMADLAGLNDQDDQDEGDGE